MSRKFIKKSNYFLDVAQIIATGPQKLFQSPLISPVTPEASLNSFSFLPFQSIYSKHSTPLNYPLITQFQRNQPSPYLKQLINPRQYTQIQFLDFTLQGPTQQDIQFQKYYEQASYEQYCNEVIEQDELEYEKSDLSHVNYSNLQSIPLTLSYMESSKLNMKSFKSKLKQLKNQYRLYGQNEEQIRQFVQSYLTEEDFDYLKERQENVEIVLEQLIKMAQYNLRNVGPISWLQRKVKVQKYIQKKKRRIWNKKINYDCRKKVAENRLRVKGKFVTQQQACSLIGVEQDCSLQYLKQILTKKDKNS